MLGFNEIHFEEHTGLKKLVLLEYVLKCVVGIMGTFLLFLLFPKFHDSLYWVIISLLLSITYNNSSKAAYDRMKGNTIGPFIGLGCYFLQYFLLARIGAYWDMIRMFSVLVGVLIVIMLCVVFKVMDVVRTALVGFFIVMIYEDDHHTWQGAAMRIGGVIIGCFLGLVINKVFRWFGRRVLGIND